MNGMDCDLFRIYFNLGKLKAEGSDKGFSNTSSAKNIA